MIVQLKGNVGYPITLDPTVWIFDDRKIILEEAFTIKDEPSTEEDKLKRQAEIFERVYTSRHEKPPVNKSINRFEKDKILTHSYVMPIKDFIEHAEVSDQAERVLLKGHSDDDIVITLDQLMASYLLFALKGKPIKDDGPVQLIFGDGSNVNNPIKGINQIIID